MNTPKQQRIYLELQRMDRRAAQAYRGALRVLGDIENPDRFSQAAHSLREVTNLISRKVSIPQKTKKETMKRKIARQFVEEPDLLPTPSERETRTLIRRWGELHDFFLSITHHGKGVNEEEFLARLSEFEAILFQFLKPTPITLQELDSLLTVQSPTPTDIKRLSELLKHPTHVEYFFHKLIHPSWLIPLKEQGFFARPPASIREGGYVMFPSWPLSRYLIRVSRQRPREVMNIIEVMQETDNYRVHLDMITCALQMSSLDAKYILAFAKEWLITPYPTPIPEKLGELCVKLSEENEVGSALELLDSLLDVKSEGDESKLLPKRAQPHFDEWSYGQILSKVVPKILQKEPHKVIELLCKKLSKAIDLEKSEKGTPYDDFSYIWRPAIEKHPQNRDSKDVLNLLVFTIREDLEALGKRDEDLFRSCYELLSMYSFSIFRRMQLHLMRLFPEILDSKIQNTLSQREVFEDIGLWHEYYHLLQEQYPNLPKNTKERILEWIGEGPDLKRYETWHEQERGFPPTKDEKEAYVAHWQMRHLSPIKDAVSSRWREKWDELVAKYEAPEHPDFHAYMGPVVIGSISPLTKEEIEAKSPEEVLSFLRTWKPSKGFMSPSREGLGESLSKVVSEDPTNYLGICGKFKTLPPVYIFSLLEGFREAAKRGNAFDWTPVVSLCKDIFIASEQTTASVDKDNLYDWKSVKRRIADLLQEGLDSKSMSIPFELRGTIWELITLLLLDDEPSVSFETESRRGNMDPIELSLNTVRGKAMHVLFRYALWCARCLNSSKREDRMVPEVRQQLEKMLNPEFEPTKTIRAVYGQYLPNLFFLNKLWTEKCLPKIFPDDPKHRALWRTAWEAYVTCCRLYTSVYEKIRRQYEIAVNKLDSTRISKTAKEKLAEHILTAYIRGAEGLAKDSLTYMFFQQARPEIRGHAIWFVGKVLQHLSKGELDEKSKDEIVRRAMDLWEWRLEEAEKVDDQAVKKFVQEFKSFGIWFIHGSFDNGWTISHLCRTLQLTEGTIELTHGVIENLPNYSREHWSDVLKILVSLIRGSGRGLLLRSSKEKIVETIEAIVMRYPPEKIKPLLNDLVDVLTRMGYFEFARFFIK